MKIKSPLILTSPRLSPAQRARFKSLSVTIVGALAADSAQSAAIAKLQRDIGQLDRQITAIETSGETSAVAAQNLSTLRTQKELFSNHLAKAQRQATQPRTDKLTQARLDAFNSLSRELADFLKDYHDERVKEFAAILTPLFTDGASIDPAGHAAAFVRNSNLLTTLAQRFIVSIRERRTGIVGQTAADRLIAIVDLLLSGKPFFAGDNLRNL